MVKLSYVKCDKIVMGAGFAGLAVAHQLTEQGFRPTVVLDPDQSSLASSASLGIFCSKGLGLPESPLFTLKLRGQQRLVERLKWFEGQGTPVLHQIGSILEPFRDFDDFARLSGRVYRKQPMSVAGVGFAKWPFNGSSPFIGCLNYPQDGWLCPLAYREAFMATLRSRGVEFVAAKICRLESEGSGVRLIGDTTQLTCRHLFVCAGAGSNSLFAGLERERFKPLVEVPGSTWTANRACPWVGGIVLGTRSLNFRGSDVVFGSSSLTRKPSADLEEERKTLDSELENCWLEDTFGPLGTWGFQSSFGIRVRTQNRLPLMGRLWSEGESAIFALTGMFKNGLQLSEICAEALVQLALGQSVDPVFKKFMITSG